MKQSHLAKLAMLGAIAGAMPISPEPRRRSEDYFSAEELEECQLGRERGEAAQARQERKREAREENRRKSLEGVLKHQP